MIFETIDELKEANERINNHWFSDQTMSFFKTRIESQIHNNYFITSELAPGASNRRYTIRKANSDGSVNTYGEFQEFSTFEAAEIEMNRLLDAA